MSTRPESGHYFGDGCLPPHETPGEVASPDPALELIREQNRILHGAETVDHPAHYNGNPSGVECITVVEWMTFNVGNAVKYLWRCFDKGDPVENLRKAIWYCEREIQRLEAGDGH